MKKKELNRNKALEMVITTFYIKSLQFKQGFKTQVFHFRNQQA